METKQVWDLPATYYKWFDFIVLSLVFILTAILCFLSVIPGSHLTYLPLSFAPLLILTSTFLGLKIARIIAFFALFTALTLGINFRLPFVSLAVQLSVLGIIIFLLSLREKSTYKQFLYTKEELHRLDLNYTKIQADISGYQRQIVSLTERIQRYRTLSLAVHQLGSCLDSRQIKDRLLDLLLNIFTGSKVSLTPIQDTPDQFTQWVANRSVPLLVGDTRKDVRFSTPETLLTRSVIAIPLVLQKKIVAVIRLENDTPYFFTNEDLRLVDILSLITAQSLENSELYAQVRELSVTDTLTGLYTHNYFQEHLNEEILRSGRYHYTVGTFLIDVDHFKKYNDTYGHQVGDRVLQIVAETIKDSVTYTDTVSRYGGEEFAVLLPQTEANIVNNTAENIRKKIDEQIFRISDLSTRITISIGVAIFPQDATTSSQLIRVADERLYRAKTAGRNRVVARDK